MDDARQTATQVPRGRLVGGLRIEWRGRGWRSSTIACKRSVYDVFLHGLARADQHAGLVDRRPPWCYCRTHSGGSRIEGVARGSIGRASAMRSLAVVYGLGKGDGEVGTCESRGGKPATARALRARGKTGS